MPDAGKKRSYDEEDEPAGKKSRGDGDSKDSAVHVHQEQEQIAPWGGCTN